MNCNTGCCTKNPMTGPKLAFIKDVAWACMECPAESFRRGDMVRMSEHDLYFCDDGTWAPRRKCTEKNLVPGELMGVNDPAELAAEDGDALGPKLKKQKIVPSKAVKMSVDATDDGVEGGGKSASSKSASSSVEKVVANLRLLSKELHNEDEVSSCVPKDEHAYYLTKIKEMEAKSPKPYRKTKILKLEGTETLVLDLTEGEELLWIDVRNFGFWKHMPKLDNQMDKPWDHWASHFVFCLEEPGCRPEEDNWDQISSWLENRDWKSVEAAFQKLPEVVQDVYYLTAVSEIPDLRKLVPAEKFAEWKDRFSFQTSEQHRWAFSQNHPTFQTSSDTVGGDTACLFIALALIQANAKSSCIHRLVHDMEFIQECLAIGSCRNSDFYKYKLQHMDAEMQYEISTYSSMSEVKLFASTSSNKALFDDDFMTFLETDVQEAYQSNKYLGDVLEWLSRQGYMFAKTGGFKVYLEKNEATNEIIGKYFIFLSSRFYYQVEYGWDMPRTGFAGYDSHTPSWSFISNGESLVDNFFLMSNYRKDDIAYVTCFGQLAPGYVLTHVVDRENSALRPKEPGFPSSPAIPSVATPKLTEPSAAPLTATETATEKLPAAPLTATETATEAPLGQPDKLADGIETPIPQAPSVSQQSKNTAADLSEQAACLVVFDSHDETKGSEVSVSENAISKEPQVRMSTMGLFLLTESLLNWNYSTYRSFHAERGVVCKQWRDLQLAVLLRNQKKLKPCDFCLGRYDICDFSKLPPLDVVASALNYDLETLEPLRQGEESGVAPNSSEVVSADPAIQISFQRNDVGPVGKPVRMVFLGRKWEPRIQVEKMSCEEFCATYNWHNLKSSGDGLYECGTCFGKEVPARVDTAKYLVQHTLTGGHCSRVVIDSLPLIAKYNSVHAATQEVAVQEPLEQKPCSGHILGSDPTRKQKVDEVKQMMAVIADFRHKIGHDSNCTVFRKGSNIVLQSRRCKGALCLYSCDECQQVRRNGLPLLKCAGKLSYTRQLRNGLYDYVFNAVPPFEIRDCLLNGPWVSYVKKDVQALQKLEGDALFKEICSQLNRRSHRADVRLFEPDEGTNTTEWDRFSELAGKLIEVALSGNKVTQVAKNYVGATAQGKHFDLAGAIRDGVLDRDETLKGIVICSTLACCRDTDDELTSYRGRYQLVSSDQQEAVYTATYNVAGKSGRRIMDRITMPKYSLANTLSRCAPIGTAGDEYPDHYAASDPDQTLQNLDAGTVLLWPKRPANVRMPTVFGLDETYTQLKAQRRHGLVYGYPWSPNPEEDFSSMSRDKYRTMPNKHEYAEMLLGICMKTPWHYRMVPYQSLPVKRKTNNQELTSLLVVRSMKNCSQSLKNSFLVAAADGTATFDDIEDQLMAHKAPGRVFSDNGVTVVRFGSLCTLIDLSALVMHHEASQLWDVALAQRCGFHGLRAILQASRGASRDFRMGLLVADFTPFLRLGLPGWLFASAAVRYVDKLMFLFMSFITVPPGFRLCESLYGGLMFNFIFSLISGAHISKTCQLRYRVILCGTAYFTTNICEHFLASGTDEYDYNSFLHARTKRILRMLCLQMLQKGYFFHRQGSGTSAADPCGPILGKFDARETQSINVEFYWSNIRSEFENGNMGCVGYQLASARHMRDTRRSSKNYPGPEPTSEPFMTHEKFQQLMDTALIISSKIGTCYTALSYSACKKLALAPVADLSVPVPSEGDDSDDDIGHEFDKCIPEHLKKFFDTVTTSKGSSKQVPPHEGGFESPLPEEATTFADQEDMARLEQSLANDSDKDDDSDESDVEQHQEEHADADDAHAIDDINLEGLAIPQEPPAVAEPALEDDDVTEGERLREESTPKLSYDKHIADLSKNVLRAENLTMRSLCPIIITFCEATRIEERRGKAVIASSTVPVVQEPDAEEGLPTVAELVRDANLHLGKIFSHRVSRQVQWEGENKEHNRVIRQELLVKKGCPEDTFIWPEFLRGQAVASERGRDRNAHQVVLVHAADRILPVALTTVWRHGVNRNGSSSKNGRRTPWPEAVETRYVSSARGNILPYEIIKANGTTIVEMNKSTWRKTIRFEIYQLLGELVNFEKVDMVNGRVFYKFHEPYASALVNVVLNNATHLLPLSPLPRPVLDEETNTLMYPGPKAKCKAKAKAKGKKNKKKDGEVPLIEEGEEFGPGHFPLNTDTCQVGEENVKRAIGRVIRKWGADAILHGNLTDLGVSDELGGRMETIIVNGSPITRDDVVAKGYLYFEESLKKKSKQKFSEQVFEKILLCAQQQKEYVRFVKAVAATTVPPPPAAPKAAPPSMRKLPI